MSLQLDGIIKRYGERAVLGPVSLTVGEGELVALMGPSGSGKSTLLRIVAGLLSPDGGSLRSGVTELTHLDPGDRDVAMVFQSYALFPHLTIYENLAFGLRARGIAAEQLATEVSPVAETLGLTPMLQRTPRELSGGERQRVALGRAMLRRPRLFLLDEPLSNLDTQLRTQMRSQIAQLQRKLGVATLYVTHDHVEALSLGDRVGVLRDGKLEQLAPPRQLYDRPATVFVARFVGQPGMNILDAQVVAGSVRVDGVEVTRAALPDGPVLLGIRAEHLRPGGPLRANVTARESLGDHLLVSSRTATQPVLAKLGADEAVPDAVGWSFAPERVRFFDSATERAIEVGA